MDTTAQNKNDDQVVRDNQNQQDQNTQPQQTVTNPVSSVNKERGITATAEFIKPSEPEPNIPAEVAAAGVEKVDQRPKLEEIHEQIGVKYSGESTPALTKPTGTIKLPMTAEEAEKEVKKDKKMPVLSFHEHGKEAGYIVPSSFFLATLVLKVLDRVKSLGRN